MQWVDIGVNLLDADFDKDRDQVLERAWESGVSQMLLTATTVEECAALQTLCNTDPQRLFCTAGIHPHHARDWSADTEADLRLLAQTDPVRPSVNAAWTSIATSPRGQCRSAPSSVNWNWRRSWAIRSSCMNARPATRSAPSCGISATVCPLR